MVHLDPLQFARDVQDGCDRSELVVTYDIRILDDTVVKVRVVLNNDAFVDVFYNADTGKCSYALVEGAARVFVADNPSIGWRIHPFEDPSNHVPSSEVGFGGV